MVPYRQQPTALPLLPWEKQLIAALECSEYEYREFISELHKRAAVRPAGYEHIPDVRNDPLTVAIISLVVGVVSTAASYFLAPKPKELAASSQDQVTLSKLENATGRQSYAPTYGFSSTQQLAQYGAPVPIVFTKQELRTDDVGEIYYSGGVLISPLLVWSRIKSFGNYQVIELQMVAGQAPMERSDLTGIFIGNNTLDAMHDESYQFYYTGGFDEDTSSRLTGRNLRYGRLAQPPAVGYDQQAFFCPTQLGGGRPGFCHTYTPSSQTRFGVYSAIPNGTPYRLNWEVISVPVLEGKERSAAEQEAARQYRIVAQSDFDSVLGGQDLAKPYQAGMPGVGRNYGRHVGVVEHNGFTVPSPDAAEGTGTRIRTVNKGDRIKIVVGYGRQVRKPVWSKDSITVDPDINTEDVRSTTDTENVRYDSQFKLGSYFLIGRCLFVVVERSSYIFEPGISGSVNVYLECVETWSRIQNKIGLVGINKVEKEDFLIGPDISEAFFPICQVELANIVNNKDCDVTELGLRSNVWLRFDGICNFNAIPTPDQLINRNNKKIQLSTSFRSTYGARASYFLLYVRPANEDPDGSAKWELLKMFCVRGSSPVDQYNFIRIFHPKRDRYEFRIRPITSGEHVFTGDANERVWQLDSTANYGETTLLNPYGNFVIGAKFREIINKSTWELPEMIDRPSQYGQTAAIRLSDGTVPRSISYQGLVQYGTNNYAGNFKESNVWSTKVGVDPFYNGLGEGAVREFDIVYTDGGQGISGNREITMRVKLQSYRQYRAQATDGRNLWWRVVSIAVVSGSGSWKNGDVIRKQRFYDGFGAEWEAIFMISGLQEGQITVPASIGRKFEEYPGIAEVSHYGDLIRRSCDDGPEHEIVYVNESLEERLIPQYSNLAMAGLKLKSGFNITNVDQLHLYMKNGVNVELLTDGGIGPSNLFTDLAHYLLTNSDIGVGGIISQELIDREQLAATGRYLRANGLLFDDVIAEGINVRSYLASKAPSMLCNLVTKNGIFSIEPALPINSSNIIDGTIKVPISAIFTDGNIIEDSFSLDYLGLEERKMFQAVVRYRKERQNKFPENRTVTVRFKEDGDKPFEEFDLSHVTSTSHAIKIAKFYLSLRKYVTHSISFKTTPDGNALQPGDWIKVATASSPYNPVANGIVKADGTIVSTEPLAAGSYSVFYWDRSSSTISEGTLVVNASGVATSLLNTIFSVKSNTQSNYENVYQIEALDIDQDGIVGIKATEFPVDSAGRSIIAQDVTPRSGQFDVIADVLD
jgi:hypothetical protein